ncbi:zona pellucida sperm-binding protein 3-like, partial [Suncus etruscus]|uniref:zona pellucida sperm-binding protein 3-like n=1 Tax=Suncus etruscus TaxID=109475 RepID=UPI0021107437
VATPTPDQWGSPSHIIVDSHGCLVDGLSDASSAFQAPRPGPEKLRFTVDVFYFANDSRNTVYITCHLKAIPADRDPDPQHKACSFNKASRSWSPVEGFENICDCCTVGDCGAPVFPENMTGPMWQQDPISRTRRHVTQEADVTLGPLIFLGRAGDHGEDPSLHGSLALALGLAALASVILAALVLTLSRARPMSPAVPHPASAS